TQDRVEITENNLSSDIPDECKGNFTYETFHTVLQQLELKCNEIYLSYVSELVVPGNENFTIWVIPKINSLEKDEWGYESFLLDKYILLTDTGTGNIVSKYFQPAAWSSDAYRLAHINIDTLDYRLNDSRIFFGVHSGYGTSSSVNPGGHQSLELFALQDNKLVSVFEYTTNDYRGENDGGTNGCGWNEEYKTHLFVTDHKINGFSDFALLTEYRSIETKNYEVVQDSLSCDSVCFYSYTPRGYTKVNKIEGTFCREIKDGWGKRECFYFGKTLPEVYQIIYDENKENLQQYMLPELPPEVVEYSRKDNRGEIRDSLTIYYRYRDVNDLVIEFATDLGSEYTAFEEKQGYTIFRYDYHD
ncbi:MAG: hypothetical protein LIP01_09415, partial [Tannerellaceae bacterium]|nr:hypothetical protein [Tannerellaceae bacterium]